ncbi:hypothetical protein CCHR01_14267 [Colletotrichum chrysophilum]|uniref:Uncharacterized protein n=1 Tax=Colletotrichum chrysophilum TaxID=1836956 RepID=A0AAD9A7X1_9PEZI|nr:hypothetical protein CCHR01_14267 [Colletotrichum chrysophilum]
MSSVSHQKAQAPHYGCNERFRKGAGMNKHVGECICSPFTPVVGQQINRLTVESI